MPKTDTSFVARYGETIVRGGIAAIPNALYRYQKELSLSPQLVWFISAVLAHKWDADLPSPSLSKMADQTGVSRRQLHNYQRDLVELELLIIINRHNEQGGKESNLFDFSPLFGKLVELLERDKGLPEKSGQGNSGGGGDPHVNASSHPHVNASSHPHVNASSHPHVNASSHPHVNASSHLKESVIEESVKQDIYPSNIRKAKSDGIDYVNAIGSANGIAEGDSLTHNEEVEPSQPHSSTNGRNVEENEKYKTFVREQHMRSSPPHVETTRTGGVAHISQTLQARIPTVHPTVPAADARDAIERLIRDTAAKLHDEAPLKSSTTRAFNLYQRSGLDLGTFYTLMYDAEKEANRRSATIKKLTTQGYKNRMVYFFALLEDKLGLRQASQPVVT